MTSLPMTPIVTAFAASPDRGRGLARDMPVRWALEEVGQPYEVRLLSFSDLRQPAHRALQPFAQIPTFQEGELALFESGAIVLHIAQRHDGLLPPDPDARARAITWMFAALNSIEPVIVERETALFTEREKSWHAEHLAMIEARLHKRLAELAQRLGTAPWLDGAFSAGDLLMAQVLRRLGGSALLQTHPNLADYVSRAEARPAFQRAFASQVTVFARSEPSAPAP